MPAPGVDSEHDQGLLQRAGRHDPRPAEPLLGRRALAVLALRARDHAVRHGLDHPAAHDRRRSRSSSSSRRRARPATPRSTSTRATSRSCSRPLQALGYAYLFKRAGRAPRLNAGPHRADRRHAHRRHDAADVDGRADHEARHRQRHLAPDLRVDPLDALRPASAPGSNGGPIEQLFFPLIALAIIVAVVFIQEGQRRIPIQYAKRMVGRRMTVGRLDLHAAAREHGRRHPDHLRRGVMAFPPTIAQFFPQTQGFINAHFTPDRACSYLLLEAFLIVIFTYFYTAVQFNPSTRPTTCASTAATSRASGPARRRRSTSTAC